MTPRDMRRMERMEKRVKYLSLALALFSVMTLAMMAGLLINTQQPQQEPPEIPQTEPVTREPETEPPVTVESVGDPVLDAAPSPETTEPTEPEPRYDITPEELDLVARVVTAEARGEGFDGQALVAQCILNTAEAMDLRPIDVVLAPKQYAAPADRATDEVIAAVEAVFLEGYQVTDEPIRWFYAPARSAGTWHESRLEYVLTHGGHKFFKEK